MSQYLILNAYVQVFALNVALNVLKINAFVALDLGLKIFLRIFHFVSFTQLFKQNKGNVPT